MAALDFPASPSVGQVYSPGGAGQSVYLWDGTAWTRLAQPDNSPTAGFRNILINGAPEVAQRVNPGANMTTAYYVIDRWQMAPGGTSKYTVTGPPLPQFVPGAVGNPPGEPQYYFDVNITTGAAAGSYNIFVQYIEGARAVNDGQYTLSFWAKGPANAYFSPELYTYFGSGGSPSAAVSQPLGKLGPFLQSQVWQRFELTFTVPSWAAKTLGSDGLDYSGMFFWLDAGSTYVARSSGLGTQSGQFSFAQMQLEKGPRATIFERRPRGIELWMCQRYYGVGVQYQMFSNYPTGGGLHDFQVNFKTPMRVTPTMVRSFSSLFHASMSSPSTDNFKDRMYLVGDGTFTNISATLNWTATAEY